MEPILQERVNIVRQYETYCYQVCYYLLKDEHQAFKAAQKVILRLIQNESLCKGSTLEIEQYIKKEAMKQSISVSYPKEELVLG